MLYRWFQCCVTATAGRSTSVTEVSDQAIFWVMVAARFFVPLAIPRYPLPAIVASLILDGIDQTTFQLYTNLPLDHYQGYDKALDIYYLTIAYVSTIRNWRNAYAINVSRFLFCYRLIGVTLFELRGYLKSPFMMSWRAYGA
jgi:hypothetical protein